MAKVGISSGSFASARVQIELSDEVSLKELLLEHIRQDRIWKANLEATLKTYGIYFSGESSVPPENFEEEETNQRDMKLGPGDLMGMPLLSPVRSRNEGNEHFEDDRASQVSSIIPAALVRPVLADGSTYDGDGSSNNNNNFVSPSPSPSKNGPSTSVMSEGRAAKNSPVGQRMSRSMVVQNLRRRNASFGGAVEKRKLEDKKQMMFMKDTEEAKNHLEMLQNERGRSYRCKLCGHSGYTDASVLMHIRMSHIGNDRIYACKLCTYRFKQKCHLKHHLINTHKQQNALLVAGSITSSDLAMETDKSENRVLRSATSQHGGSSNGSSEPEYDLANAYETFLAENEQTGYICLTCADVSMDQSEIERHILQNHLKRGPSLRSNKSTAPSKLLPPPSPPTSTEVPETSGNRRKQALPHTHVFSEGEKEAVDQLLLNIHQPGPPFTCKICHTAFQTKQRARLHALYQHREDLDL